MCLFSPFEKSFRTRGNGYKNITNELNSLLKDNYVRTRAETGGKKCAYACLSSVHSNK